MATIYDKDLRIEWKCLHEHMVVKAPNGMILYDTTRGFVSDILTPQQVRWLTDEYQKNKKHYQFI